MTQELELTRVRRHLRAEYEGVFAAGQVDRHIEQHVQVAAAQPLVEVIRAYCTGDVRILDAGCGYGAFVLAARAEGLDATGLDSAEFEISFARERLASTTPDADPSEVFVLGDGLALPFPDRSFSVITLWNVLEHVPNYGSLLAEAARVLRPGGWLFGIAPNYASFRREAHYHVPWPPLLPRRIALSYLALLGRDPSFFQESIFYCTNGGVRTELKRKGLRLASPRTERLSRPETIRRPMVRRIVVLLGRLGLGWIPLGLARALEANPLRRTIRIQAQKAAAG
jgi:SAM-dependent methyltransferase